jgi:hypothetical protein
MVPDPDFFEWETHIFFDDAFEPDDSGKLTVVNQVKHRLEKTQTGEGGGLPWYSGRVSMSHTGEGRGGQNLPKLFYIIYNLLCNTVHIKNIW